MIKLMRGIIILTGIVLIFMVITACSTDSVFAKKNKSNTSSDENYRTSDREDYFYDDGTGDSSEYAGSREKNINSGSSRNSDSGKDADNNYSRADDNTDYNSYYQKGYASWYGREFHGRKTASGEKYDMNKLTAAHKELPFGTKILVKNLENNREVTVTVNDRGPYRNSRVLDLSYAAARQIGIIGNGEAKVGIKIIKNRNNEADSFSENSIEAVSGRGEDSFAVRDYSDNNFNNDEQGGDFSIQAGAFYSRRNAEKLQKRLESMIDNPVVLVNDNDMYKVRIDRITSRKSAERVKRTLENDDISSYIIEHK